MPAIIQRVQEKEIKMKDAKAGRKLSKVKHAKAGSELSREGRRMDVIMRQIVEMERKEKARINASQCSHQRAAATQGTRASIDASGGDSKDDMLPEATRLPCAARGSKIANSHEHGTRLASICTPEARVLATRASSDQAHTRKREASLKSQQSKDRRVPEEEESTERIIQDLLANSERIDKQKHTAYTREQQDR